MGDIINNESGFNTLDNEPGGDYITVPVFQDFSWNNNATNPLYALDALISPYTKYTISVEYITDNGVLQIPVAPFNDSGDTSAFFVKARSSHSIKRILFIGERTGAFPIVPLAGGDQNPNYVLLSSRIQTMSPKATSDGFNLVFRIAGEIVYGAVNPVDQVSGNANTSPYFPASAGLDLTQVPPLPLPLDTYNLDLEY